MTITEILNTLRLKNARGKTVTTSDVKKLADSEEDADLVFDILENEIDILDDESVMEEENIDVEAETEEVNVSRYVGTLNDTVRMYLMDIARYTTLPRETECELLHTIVDNREVYEEWDELLNTGEAETIDPDVAKTYIEVYDKYNSAKDKIICHNLKLVVSIAKRYTGRGVDFMDLIQEGNMGLTKAISKYNYDINGQEYKFSTYATWWIRQSITRAIADQSRTIRIPVHLTETINKINRTRVSLINELARDVTNQEVADRLGMSLDKLEQVLLAEQKLVSLDSTVGEDDDSFLMDFIEDTNNDDPMKALLKESLSTEIRKIFKEYIEGAPNSNYMEKHKRARAVQVIIWRFGLDGNGEKTLQECGEMMGVTRERVRQIEAKFLLKIRRNKQWCDILKSYLTR